MGSNGTKKYPPSETLVQCVASCSYMLNYQFYGAFLKWGDLKLAGWFIMEKWKNVLKWMIKGTPMT